MLFPERNCNLRLKHFLCA